jgi:hypothetical protein
MSAPARKDENAYGLCEILQRIQGLAGTPVSQLPAAANAKREKFLFGIAVTY